MGDRGFQLVLVICGDGAVAGLVVRGRECGGRGKGFGLWLVRELGSDQ